LTEWGCKQLARHVERINRKGPDALLAYDGARDDKVAQISSCIAITDVLRMTGLAKEPDVRSHSVVAWAGRVLSETSHIMETSWTTRHLLATTAGIASMAELAGTTWRAVLEMT